MVLLGCFEDQSLDLIGLFFAPRTGVVIGTVAMVMNEEVNSCTKVTDLGVRVHHPILYMKYKDRDQYGPLDVT